MRQEFVEELKNTIEGMINGVHTALPGKILKYSIKSGRAQVQPLGKHKAEDGELLNYPIVSDVPVVLIEDENEDVSISRPIKRGQGCLLIFAEQALENWYFNGAQPSDLKFDLTSAICIPGLFRTPSKNTAEATIKDAVIIKNKKAKATLYPTGKIEVEGTLYVTENVVVNGIRFLHHDHKNGRVVNGINGGGV